MEMNKYNSMVNGIFHTVFFWTCSRAAGAAAAGGGGTGMMVAAAAGAGAAVAATGGATGAGPSFSGILGASSLNGVKWSTFIFGNTSSPGRQPGQQVSFSLLWQKMCTDQRKQHQLCHLSLLAFDIAPPHSPTFKASPAFFVPLSHALRRT